MEICSNNTTIKGKKDTKDVMSYRSISLTDILSKIFNKMTNKRLVWYLKKEKKIDDRQFGFRKQKHNRCKIKNNKILD